MCWILPLSQVRRAAERWTDFNRLIADGSRVPYVVGAIYFVFCIVEVVSFFVVGRAGSKMRLGVGAAFLAVAVFYLPWLWLRWQSIKRDR